MATSLYDLSVANYLQTLGGVAGILDKGLAHFTANKIDPNDIVEARLAPDMLPFRFQILSIAHHSLGAIEGVKRGEFLPPGASPEHDYAALQKIIADTSDALKKLTPAEINALEGHDMTFKIRDFKIPFTAANFILSFSLPNFYFHATTAYDILRTKGVQLGKRDYMGQMRMKM